MKTVLPPRVYGYMRMSSIEDDCQVGLVSIIMAASSRLFIIVP